MALVKRRDYSSENGISLDLLERIERHGIINPIDINGEAYYTDEQQLRIQVVMKGRRLGFSIQEIGRIIDSAAGKDSFLDRV